MKAFLEEYGLIVVVVIVIAVLIALAVWSSNKGKGSAETTINQFTSKADAIVSDVMSSANINAPVGEPTPTPGT